MSTPIEVRQGWLYQGGADKPFYVTFGMIHDWLAENGFDQIEILDREDFGPVPMGIDPNLEWNTGVRARRVGPDATITPPKDPAWIQGSSPPVPSQQPPAPAPAPAPAPGPVSPKANASSTTTPTTRTGIGLAVGAAAGGLAVGVAWVIAAALRRRPAPPA